jgi:hypothetical protein
MKSPMELIQRERSAKLASEYRAYGIRRVFAHLHKQVRVLITTVHCAMGGSLWAQHPLIGSHPAFLALFFFGGFSHA